MFWWADDGKEVAYMTTDLKKMQSYNISYYSGRQYPFEHTQKYAKPGVRELEKVDLKIWNKETKYTIKMAVDLPER